MTLKFYVLFIFLWIGEGILTFRHQGPQVSTPFWMSGSAGDGLGRCTLLSVSSNGNCLSASGLATYSMEFGLDWWSTRFWARHHISTLNMSHWWRANGWTGWSCGSFPTLAILWFYDSFFTVANLPIFPTSLSSLEPLVLIMLWVKTYYLFILGWSVQGWRNCYS